jgi:diguanylate cyclase (GGDEF)-like protein
MLEDQNIEHKHSGVADRVTVSMGISTHDTGSSYIASDLIEAADKALYKAKEDGRNTEVLASSL